MPNWSQPELALYGMKWSDAEKKLARRVFMGALETELAEVIADFKIGRASCRERVCLAV